MLLIIYVILLMLLQLFCNGRWENETHASSRAISSMHAEFSFGKTDSSRAR